MARSKSSFSLEIFNLARNVMQFFMIFGPLGFATAIVFFFAFCTVFLPLLCLEQQACLSPLRSVLLPTYRIFSPFRNSRSVVLFSTGGSLRHCSTNWRCIAAFPSLHGLEARKAQRYKWGEECGANWRCIAALFTQGVQAEGS